MRRTLEKFFASPYLTVFLMFYCVFLIFIATIAQLEIGVAKASSVYFESFFAITEIQGVPFFIIGGASVGVLAVVNIFFSLFKYVRFGVVGIGNSIIHCSLVLLILSGGLQYFMRVEGRVSIREGESTKNLFVRKNAVEHVQQLPFSIKLLNFTKENWEGSDIPKSFSSKVVFVRGNSNTECLIEMNSPASFEGWTFYQTSYADNGKVSVLTAVKNPARMLPWLAVIATFAGMTGVFVARILGRKKL